MAHRYTARASILARAQRLTSVLLLALTLAGCADVADWAGQAKKNVQHDRISEAEVIGVYRLDPAVNVSDRGRSTSFDGWKVLRSGRPSGQDAEWLKSQLLMMVASESELMAGCFDPHHGLLLAGPDGGAEVHVAVCFDCGNLTVGDAGVTAFSGGDEARWDAVFEASGAGPRLDAETALTGPVADGSGVEPARETHE